MHYILFDDIRHNTLLPFTHTRPVADIRCGIFTMRERWERLLGQTTTTLTQPYLQTVYPIAGNDIGHLYINGALFGNQSLAQQVTSLPQGQVLMQGELIIAARPHQPAAVGEGIVELIEGLEKVDYNKEVILLRNVWDIFSLNDQAIKSDYEMVSLGGSSAPVPEGVLVVGDGQLFIDEGATIYPGCIINAATGPVYIGKGAEVLEGSLMRGPIAICSHAVVKMGAKIYGATTIGPGCKVGGEINNAVFFANSNKSHDGYLGNAVIGEWCNLGADTNCSNLKNNYDVVKIWDEAAGKMVSTGLIFCGLMMGDHSKCSINSMFNTGTVVGVSCNIFGSGFPDKFVPSFTWGGAGESALYVFDKAMDTANRMMGRRGLTVTDADKEMYRYIYDAVSNL